MKIYTAGEIKPNILEQEKEIQPFESFTKEALKRLNFILGFVEEQNPDAITKYIENLIAQYKKLVKEDLVEKLKIDYKKILNDFDHLQKQPELAKLSFNFYLQNIEIPVKVDWTKDKTKVKIKNQLFAFLLPRYYNLSALIETLGREEGIKLYKRYITHYYLEARKTRENRYANIKELFDARRKPAEEPSEWSVHYGLISEGKYFYRNNNCTWVEALKDLPDSEMKYLICCYGDYEAAKFHNDNFILTMEHTLAQEDPYCSRVIHDIRVDYDLRHPPKEFWDTLDDKVSKE